MDDTVEAPVRKLVFVTDQEKAALNGVSVDEIARTLRLVLSGGDAGTVRLEGERNPLRVELRLPRAIRSSQQDLASIRVKGRTGQFTALSELGSWEEARVDQTIYHKNLERVVYVTAETLGRTPAECVLDVTFDRRPDGNLPERAQCFGSRMGVRRRAAGAFRANVHPQRRRRPLGGARWRARRVQRRGRVEDHARRVPRPRPRVRRRPW